MPQTLPPHHTVSFDLKEDNETLLPKIKEFITTKVFVNETIHSFGRLTGGLTNMLYKAIIGDNTVLVRVNGIGTENIIDREKEILYMSELYESGKLAPKTYCTFENGSIYDYKEGESLQPQEMPIHAVKIAQEMAKFHKANVEPANGDRSPSLFKDYIRKWLVEARKIPFEGEQKTKFEKIDLDKLSREIDELEERVKDEKVVFCHDDLLSLNIIYDKNTDSISFIDYEYCGYNYQAFDIGNHFCEYAGFELNIDAYPNEQQQKKFISAYLAEYNQSKPSEQEIEIMYQKVDTFAQLSNIFWSVWAIQQAHFSEIEFDYLEYCIKRLDWYRSQANASKNKST